MQSSNTLRATVSRVALMAGIAATVGALPRAALAQSGDGQPIQLPAVTVEGQQGAEGYKADYSASPKFTAPLLDTPKSVTVIPQELIEDRAAMSLMQGQVEAGHGCPVTMTFASIPSIRCQPDLVEKPILELFAQDEITKEEKDRRIDIERRGVRPQFNSVRYGKPEYCQLAETCATEIKRGADDESEMGVFHDLFNPQRDANLRARLNEYTPAGTDAGIIYAS